MNLILFEAAEISRPLPADDPRAKHLKTILRFGLGDAFDIGIINGARGKARISHVAADGALHLETSFTEAPPALDPIHLIVGLPRPQTSRKILREAAALGVSAMDFVKSEKSEPSYADSSLWHSGEVRQLLIEASQQAFCTRLPEVKSGVPLRESLAQIPPDSLRIALDNYEASEALSPSPLIVSHPEKTSPTFLAIGPERGWGTEDRAELRAAGFTLLSLGKRVLRTETACVAALAVLKARLGLL